MVTWDVYNVNGSPAKFLNASIAGINPKIPNEVITDPIQKTIPDCFFLAALGSCAWTPLAPSNIPSGAPNGTSFTIPFWWYDKNVEMTPTTVFTTKPIPVSNTLPLENGKPLYAQPTPQNEIWAAIYQKAFALLATCPKDANGVPDLTKLPAVPDMVQYSAMFTPGSALSVLVYLTGKKFSFTSTVLPQTAFSLQGVTSPPPAPSPFKGQPCSDYFDIIKTVCILNAGIPSFGKTSYPMVAWTYDSKDYATQEWKDKGLKYEMLNAKHTYSILGCYTSATGKYIVLRDPWGKTNAPDAFINSFLAPASPLWDPVSDHTKFTPRDISTGQAGAVGGVFGLRADAFAGCFSGFGWVR